MRTKRVASYEQALSAIENGVWITPELEHCLHHNRMSIDKFTGRCYLTGNALWLISEFKKQGVDYTFLTASK